MHLSQRSLKRASASHELVSVLILYLSLQWQLTSAKTLEGQLAQSKNETTTIRQSARKLSIRSPLYDPSSKALHQAQFQAAASPDSTRGHAVKHFLASYNASAGCLVERSASSAAHTGASGQAGVAQEAGNDQLAEHPLALEQQHTDSGFVEAHVSDFLKPTFYTLRLKVDPNKRKFSGQLMVSLDIGPSTVTDAPAPANSSGSSVGTNSTQDGHRYLTLHAGLNLYIKKAFYVFTARNNIQIPATKIGHDLERGLLTLDFYPSTIASSSQGLLLLVYSGVVNDTESHGLFVHHRVHHTWGASSLRADATLATDDEHQALLGLATQMEPNFARRLFPCWDEPHLKARFSLIVILPFRGYESLSNMPVKKKSISLSCSGEPLQEVEFQTTPTMSTYLLTLVIGKFDYIESITANNCKLRVYFYSNQTLGGGQTSSSLSPSSQSLAPPQAPTETLAALDLLPVNQRRQAAQMALDLAVRSFDRLESALRVRYPLSKFDMIALRDFNSGAMENWGASIFHENYLLCDNTTSNTNIRVNGGNTRPRRLVVPLVIAHEIVHQWFGNLITSRSWTYLWLNEGFAQLLMYDVADALLPSENYWLIFLEDNRQSAMREDELITSSRALELADDELAASDDQMSLFDQLTYNKGAMLLQMVQHALGRAEFTAGLRHYLLKHSYDSVSSHDLWLALEESSDRLADGQLESLMSSWLKLEGFPLISVRISEVDEQNFKLVLSQERFTLLPREAVEQLGGNKTPAWSTWTWTTPVTVACELTPVPDELELRLWPLASGATDSASRSTLGNSFLLTDKTATLKLARSSLGAWFKLNARAIGYFRVDYESSSQVDMLARLRAPIRARTLSTIDRFNIVEDLFAMVLAGRKSLVFYLRYVADAYANEPEPLVLRFVLDSFERVRQALVSNKGGVKLEARYAAFVQKYLRKLIGALRATPNDAHERAHETGELAASATDLEAAMTHRLLAAPSRLRQSKPNDPSAARPRKLRRAASVTSLEMVAPITATDNRRQSATSSAFISLDTSARSNLKQRRSQNSSAAGIELLELLDAYRLTYNDPELLASASDLFAQLHFRSPDSSTSGPTLPPPDVKSVYDSMGRELRAAVYSGALNYKGDDESGSSRGTASDVYSKLVELYNSNETTSSLERSAIAQALGSVRDASRQAHLLNLTLVGNHFRIQDIGLVLESMATTSRQGLQLIWKHLSADAKLFKQRQVLSVALKCLSRGLIEQTASADPLPVAMTSGIPGHSEPQRLNATSVEGQLRQLYVIYGAGEEGPLIGQAIEWVRINSIWFKRDHKELAEFLRNEPPAPSTTS